MAKPSSTRRFHGGPLLFIISISVFSLLTHELSRPGTATSSSSPSTNHKIFHYKIEIPRWPPSFVVRFEDILPSVVHRQPKAPRKVYVGCPDVAGKFLWLVLQKKMET